MNVKRASIFVGTIAGFAMSGMATADFHHMAQQVVHEGDQGRTYRLYAVMDAGDRLDAVAGNSVQGLGLTTVNGFYQNTEYGGATSLAINDAFFPFAASLEWDSYVTIGALYANGHPFTSNELNTVGIDWTQFEAGNDLESDNGTWFVTPDKPQGEAQMHSGLYGDGIDDPGLVNGDGNAYGVLIAQVTTNTTGVIDGDFSALLQGKLAGSGDTWQANVNGFNYGFVPAPGALALLGLAGIAGRRRRR